MKDYEYFHNLILISKCHICDEPFTYDNKPTLDRIDNTKGHSKDNVKLCCEYCNKCKVIKMKRAVKFSLIYENLLLIIIYHLL